MIAEALLHVSHATKQAQNSDPNPKSTTTELIGGQEPLKQQESVSLLSQRNCIVPGYCEFHALSASIQKAVRSPKVSIRIIRVHAEFIAFAANRMFSNLVVFLVPFSDGSLGLIFLKLFFLHRKTRPKPGSEGPLHSLCPLEGAGLNPIRCTVIQRRWSKSTQFQ